MLIEDIDLNEAHIHVKRLRKQLGIPMYKLAAKADMHPTHYTRFENGTQAPNVQTLVKIFKAVGFAIDLRC